MYVYMRQSEMKRKYDPELGRRVKKQIYGEGLMDLSKAVGSKVMGKTTKELAKKVAIKVAEKAGDYVVKKAGDKIIQLLSKKQPMPISDISSRINQLISAGKFKLV